MDTGQAHEALGRLLGWESRPPSGQLWDLGQAPSASQFPRRQTGYNDSTHLHVGIKSDDKVSHSARVSYDNDGGGWAMGLPILKRLQRAQMGPVCGTDRTGAFNSIEDDPLNTAF